MLPFIYTLYFVIFSRLDHVNNVQCHWPNINVCMCDGLVIIKHYIIIGLHTPYSWLKLMLLKRGRYEPSPYMVLFIQLRTENKAKYFLIPGFYVTAPGAFIWFLDGNENKVDISIVGTNGKCFLINAHGMLRRMGAATEIPGSVLNISKLKSVVIYSTNTQMALSLINKIFFEESR